jgi:hypothetical protein
MHIMNRKKWQPAFGDVILNVGRPNSAIQLPDEAIQEFRSIPLSDTARSDALRAAREHIQSIAKNQEWDADLAASALGELEHSDDWMAAAQTADGLRKRYEDAFAAFGERFYDCDANNYLQCTFDVFHLVEACEAARAWRGRNDEGRAYRAQEVPLRDRKKRKAVVSRIQKASVQIRKHAKAIAIASQSALATAGLFERSSLRPSMRIFNAFHSLIARDPQSVAKAWRLLRQMRPALEAEGIDLDAMDRAFDEAHPLQTRFAFAGRERAAERLADCLMHLGNAINDGSSSRYLQVGNLNFASRPDGLPTMPSTGLAAELVALLRDMTARPAAWAPSGRLTKATDHEGQSHYEVAAAFIRCALDRDMSEDGVRKVVEDLVEAHPNVRIGAWR